jgi:hypothetical protein
MRDIAEFTLLDRVGTIKQVGSRVSICANYPFKDDKGQWKDDAHWNEVTVFTKRSNPTSTSMSARATWFTCAAGFGRTASSGQRSYTVDLIVQEFGRLAQGSDRAAA